MNKYVLLVIYILLLGSICVLTAQTATLKTTLELKDINSVKVVYQNNMPLPSFDKQNRPTISLKGIWKKKRFQADHNLSLVQRDQSALSSLLNEIGNSESADFDDSSWDEKLIPSVENIMYDFPKVPEYYQDGVLYRYKFSVADSLENKFVKLMFYSVNYVADVWLNGQYIGYHEGGFTPFAFDVSENLNYNSENVILVRVDNIKWGSRKDIIPFYNCDWFNYAGIIGDVYLEFSEPASIIRADVVPLDIEGKLSISTVLFNSSNTQKDLNLKTSIYKAHINSENIQTEKANDLILTGDLPETETFENITLISQSVHAEKKELIITNPALWSPSEPNLYVLQVQLLDGEKVVDEYSTQFGIRTIETDGNKVRLNNNVVFFTGVARHEDHPVYGRSIPNEIIYNDLELIKNSNINFLRTGHYPNNPYTYLLTDRLGITVMEEIPVWWFDNELEWLIQNNERHLHEQMFREMVFKDYNRPSIILWSTSNECKEETNRTIYNKRVYDDLNNNYPDGRLISQSSAGDKPGPADGSQNPIDVAGWTLYFGIFHGSTYFAGTVSFFSQAIAAFPNKPIIDTEFGYWSSENGSSLNEQVKVFNETFKAFQYFTPIRSNGTYNASGVLMAATWWCMFDWYSHQHPNGFQSMGLVSMDRQTKKPVYDVLAAGYKPYFDKGGTVVTSVESETLKSSEIKSYKMIQNYPNPFNASTVISFSIPDQSNVKISLFDIKGELITVLADSIFSSGEHKINLEKLNLASGIYLCRMEAEKIVDNTKHVSSIKLTLLK
ncbi:MAG: glycoside hydrolase family 2 [Ignavibacteriae bacterium HGW-Ignavibacteriae-2]|nr:MAG: glycoside hydrolase family 2 [Ignavibacteriae bacterium HGW-Ignavibacteriae-2]